MEREQRNKEWIAQRDFNRKHNRKIFQRFNGDPLYSPDRGTPTETTEYTNNYSKLLEKGKHEVVEIYELIKNR